MGSRSSMTRLVTTPAMRFCGRSARACARCCVRMICSHGLAATSSRWHSSRAMRRARAPPRCVCALRWAHPSLGLLAPAQFLPLAEQSGLTRVLTKFVVDRALEEIGELRREGFDVTVAVNLGPADLLDLGLPLEISRLLDEREFAAA